MEEEADIGFLKRKFEDQITCCICLEQFEDPRTLPCNHCFCLNCITQLKNRFNVVKCPVCRLDFKLHSGASSLPSAFHINTMIDLQKGLENPFQSQTCLKHNDPLKVFCETCDQVICRDCTVSVEHKTHTFYLISECYPKHHQQIQDSLETVDSKRKNLADKVLMGIANREEQIVKQGENIKEEINMHAQQLIEGIFASQQNLSQQVDTIVQQKTDALGVHKEQARKLHGQLEACQVTITRSLKEMNQQQILMEKKAMIDKMNKIIEEVEQSPIKHMEDFALQFKKNEFPEPTSIGQLSIDVLQNVSMRVKPCRANRRSVTSLSFFSKDGTPLSLPPSLISSTLTSQGKQSTQDAKDCSITETQPGEYDIEFTPLAKNDQLIVQVGGVDIPQSPFNIPVLPTPEMRGEPVNVFPGLNRPHGIAVCGNGDIVVAENGAHRVTILDKNGEKLKSFGGKGTKNGQFTHPSRVAISSDGHILVTDDYRLQKLTTDGVCVKSISGDEISDRGQFNYPEGIAVHPTTGMVFIADSSNNRIQVFTNDLSHSHTINPGFIFRRLKNPSDVALDNQGFVYVADLENNCVRKLTSDKGKLVGTYGSRGSTPGRLSAPSSLLIHDDHLYISEWGNHRVSVFTTEGKFVHCFGRYRKGGEGTLHGPHGIAINSDTHEIYVCDTKNNRVIVF